VLVAGLLAVVCCVLEVWILYDVAYIPELGICAETMPEAWGKRFQLTEILWTYFLPLSLITLLDVKVLFCHETWKGEGGRGAGELPNTQSFYVNHYTTTSMTSQGIGGGPKPSVATVRSGRLLTPRRTHSPSSHSLAAIHLSRSQSEEGYENTGGGGSGGGSCDNGGDAGPRGNGMRVSSSSTNSGVGVGSGTTPELTRKWVSRSNERHSGLR